MTGLVAALRAAATDSRVRGTIAAHAGLVSPPLWRAIGHPAMGGAIGVALGRFEPAIGEIPAPRIAEWPSAGESANVLEPHAPHLPNLGFGKNPCRLPLRFIRRGDGGVPLAGNGRGVGNSRQWRPIRASRRPAGRIGAPAAVELDPDSVRLADHGVAGRGVERRSDDARASSFESQPFEILDRLGCPQHLHAPWLPLRRLQPQGWKCPNSGYSPPRQPLGRRSCHGSSLQDKYQAISTC
jgi:hypothetical protein